MRNENKIWQHFWPFIHYKSKYRTFSGKISFIVPTNFKIVPLHFTRAIYYRQPRFFVIKTVICTMRILLPLVYYVFFPLGKGKQLNSTKAKWSLLNSGGAIISKTEHRILYCCDEPLSYVRQIPHSGWEGVWKLKLKFPYYICYIRNRSKTKAKWSLLNSGGAIISKTEHSILYCCDEPPELRAPDSSQWLKGG